MHVSPLTGVAHRAHAEALKTEIDRRNKATIDQFVADVAAEMARRGRGSADPEAKRPPLYILKTPPHTGQIETLARKVSELPDGAGYRRPVLCFAHTHEGVDEMTKGLNAAVSSPARKVAGARLNRASAGCQRLEEVRLLEQFGLSPARLCRGDNGYRCPHFDECLFRRQRDRLQQAADSDGVRLETGRGGKSVRVFRRNGDGEGEGEEHASHHDLEMMFVAPAVHANYANQPPVLRDAAGIVLNETRAIACLKTGALPLERLREQWRGRVPELQAEEAGAIALRDRVAEVLATALEDGDSLVHALLDAFATKQAVLDALTDVQAVLKPQAAADRASTRTTKNENSRELRSFAKAMAARDGESEWHLLEAVKRAVRAFDRVGISGVPVTLTEDDVVEFGYREPFPWPCLPVLVMDQTANPTLWDALMGESHEVFVVDNPCTPEDLYLLGLSAILYDDHSAKIKQLQNFGKSVQNGLDAVRDAGGRDRDAEVARNRREIAWRIADERVALAKRIEGRTELPRLASAMQDKLWLMLQRGEHTGDLPIAEFDGPVVTFGRVRSSQQLDADGLVLIGRNDPSDQQLRCLRLALRTTLPSGHPYHSDDVECGEVAEVFTLAHQDSPATTRPTWQGLTRLTQDLMREIREAEMALAVAHMAPLDRLHRGMPARVVVFGTVPVPGLIVTQVSRRRDTRQEEKLTNFVAAISKPAVERVFAVSEKAARKWLVRAGFTEKDHPDGWRAFKLRTARGGRPAMIWVRSAIDDAAGSAEAHARQYGLPGTPSEVDGEGN